MAHTAMVLGATGLVGGEVVKLLVQDARFDSVVALARRPLAWTHPKLRVQILDFDQPASWHLEEARADMLFSALGTTLKQAGSKEAQYKVDVTYQLEIARAAAAAGVTTYALVSAMGASASSSSFYMKMRGELEEGVRTLPFVRLRILRPGMLEGVRAEDRPKERWAIAALKVVGSLPGLKAVRPIEGAAMARALVAAALDESPGTKVYGPGELHALAAARTSTSA